MAEKRWDHRGRGRLAKMGSERMGKEAKLHGALGPGRAVVRFLYDSMYVDDEWSTRDEAGFTWWGHRLAQRIAVEPGMEHRGWTVERVTVETDLVRGLTWGPDRWPLLAAERVTA